MVDKHGSVVCHKESWFMSVRLQRLTGFTLVLTVLAAVLGSSLADPAIESHDDRAKFLEQVEDTADRIPVIYVFQVVQVASALLTVAAGLGLYLMLRERARASGLAGLLALLASAVFVAWEAFVGAGMVRAADDYAGGGLGGIGRGSEDVLELIRVLAVLHFATFLTAFATLGMGAAAFAYGLAWATEAAPRWLGWLGVVAGLLLLFTPLALTIDVLFFPFFFGATLTLVWLLAAGVWLLLRPPAAAGIARAGREEPA
jgi:hypothetical protein